MSIGWAVFRSLKINLGSSDEDSPPQIRGDGQNPAAATGLAIPFPGPLTDQELPGFPILGTHFFPVDQQPVSPSRCRKFGGDGLGDA
jgi:hypothetical protein